MSRQYSQLAEILKTDSGIAAGYRHQPKYANPEQPIEIEGAVLKWYALCAEDKPVPAEITKLARARLANVKLAARGLGFVILHRCGQDFYFLIINTWRGSNEVWETVYYKDGDAMADFEIFPRDGEHKPTFCVWELAPVWHEKAAWTRFLDSARDEAAAQSWLADLYTGVA